MIRRARTSVALVCLAFASVLAADEGTAIAGGRAGVKTWLALADAGDYPRSWDEGSAMFRAGITKPDWQKAMQSARAPLGRVLGRKQRSATYATSLPGAPAGEYVVFLFDTDFEKHTGAVETITAAREKDGSWRIAGYYIR